MEWRLQSAAVWLYVGNTIGGNEMLSANEGTVLSTTISGIPTDGRTIYTRLWTYAGGNWNYTDTSYRTALPLSVRA